MNATSGMRYFQHKRPIDPSSMSRWRGRVGQAGLEELLAETIRAGLQLKAVKPSQLKRVNLDTTVQEKHKRACVGRSQSGTVLRGAAGARFC